MNRRKVVVGTGWWSENRTSEWLIGDAITKGPAFFRVWHRLVVRALDPVAILVCDSHSPVKPDLSGLDRIRWTELDRNYGHANDIRIGRIDTKYSGFTRSMLLGAAYALCCDADYYVYVEQDCVIRGRNFLDEAIAGSSEGILVGDRTVNGRGLQPDGSAAPMFQQSLVVVDRFSLERFITGLMKGSESDGEVPPEVKMTRDCAPFGVLAVPYGRSRPIDFSRSHYYAQHLTWDELKEFAETEMIDLGELSRG